MISSAKEARECINAWDEIVEKYAQEEKQIPDDNETITAHMKFFISKGYLAALEGPEFKACIEKIERLTKIIMANEVNYGDCFTSERKSCERKIEEALSQYYGAVKK